MNGFVDDKLRALLRVPVSASRDGNRMDIVAWIDTAFNGGLVIPRKLIAESVARYWLAASLLDLKRPDELQWLLEPPGHHGSPIPPSTYTF